MSEEIQEQVSIPEVLRRLQHRLLDLTARNRLLNFKATAGKALPLVPSRLDEAFRRLTGQNPAKIQIIPVPDPTRADWIQRNERMVRPDAREHAARLGLNIDFDEAAGSREPASSVRAHYYQDDLAKHFRKLDREARLALEETGANMLFTVLGCLEYTEAPESDKVLTAPLVCVPVRLESAQVARGHEFYIWYTGEEIQENLSLREKLKRDHSVVLPDFPEEDAGLEGYFRAVEKMVKSRPGWRLRRTFTIALLSFGNMLLIRDLEPSNWSDKGGDSRLINHPVVRRMFTGGDAGGSFASYAEEYDLDRHPEADIPLIYDADSSQHSAIVDVMAGKSLVIEGPPGTGKSQTITNIIAACLNAGKSILFIAEKLTALQVVQRRLQSAGLDEFLLELHSNKTSKRHVLDSLAKRQELRTRQPYGLDSVSSALAENKKKLDQYAKLINTVTGNQLGLTVHQVLWRAEQHRRRLGASAELLSRIAVESAPNDNVNSLQEKQVLVETLAQTFKDAGAFDSSNAFWGFYPNGLAPGDDLAVQTILQTAADIAGRLHLAASKFLDEYGVALKLQPETPSPVGILEDLRELAPLLTDRLPYDVVARIFVGEPAAKDWALKTLKLHNGLLTRVLELEAATQGAVNFDALEDRPGADSRLRMAQNGGFAKIAISEAGVAVRTLSGLLHRAQSALSTLDRWADELGLRRDSEETYRQICAIFSLCERAPLAYMDMRTVELSKPYATEVLTKAVSERDRILSDESALSHRFYMDQAPTDQDLRSWILTLREGSAWYRIFQKPWRAAIRGHRSLRRDKSKVRAEQALSELESLSSLRRDMAAWSSSALLTKVAGVQSVPIDYPLNEALQVASWLRGAQDALDALSLPREVFNPVAIDRSRLAAYSPRAREASGEIGALEQLAAYVAEVFPGLSAWREEGHWSARIGYIERLCTDLSEIVSDLNAVESSDTSIESGYELIGKAQELLSKSNAIAESEDLRNVLGGRAANFRDELPAIMDAVRLGKAVNSSGLPTELKVRLLSAESRSEFDRICGHASEMQRIYEAYQASLTGLEGYGELARHEWASESGDAAVCMHDAATKSARAASEIDGLIPWSIYLQARREVVDAGLDHFAEILEQGHVEPEYLRDAFGYRFYSSIAESLFRRTPALQRFSGGVHGNLRADFARLDRELIELRGKQIAHQCRQLARPEQGSSGTRVSEKTEMALVQHLLPQSRPRISLRELLARAGTSVRQLKPCFMMGPQAVAQYLSATPEMFDVVIMDEASQMRPEQAIGAIVRGKQLVVVGDPKQLPPTSFFSRMQPEGEVNEAAVAEDAESILDLASSHFRPIRSLRWHYRSRHESLIAFSNRQFYDGKLIVFPSPFPRSQGLGVRMHYVKRATYESQTNVREAAAVVDAVVDHIIHNPGLSLGVVALNIRQRDLIAELIEERLRSTPGADAYRSRWSDEGQDIFVKNLENVQGDERDTIIISTTYGPAPGTERVHQNFGPISQEGGWRRLNVLFTRARSSVLLVTSMRHTDIVVGSGTPIGTKALRDYLLYAETGRLNSDLGEATGRAPDSEFEVAVMSALRDRGYECEPQVGVANFRIDIGVRHPRYPHLFLAAVECDGATYHSGITVRDRDRIRQEILESMGWKGKIWRIWSTEWFRNPRRELDRLESFLEDLRAEDVDPGLAIQPGVVFSGGSEEVFEPTESEVVQAEETLFSLLTDSSLDEVRVGDRVVYQNLSGTDPEREMSVLIWRGAGDPGVGVVSEDSPLGQALVGAQVGEEVDLVTPSGVIHRIRVLRVLESAAGEASVASGG